MPIGWWQQPIGAGGLHDLHVASVHPYTGNNDSFEEYGNIPALQQLEGMLGAIPLWFTEVGWWNDGDYNYLNQANVVARAMIWQKVLHVPVGTTSSARGTGATTACRSPSSRRARPTTS